LWVRCSAVWAVRGRGAVAAVSVVSD
jgi:hypothetical protein